jgi:copper chaperone CopZ
MQKVDGVQDVRVSLKEGLTVLTLKPDNRVTLARLREIIKNNGFVSRDAIVVASGNEVTEAGATVFEVGGTAERLRMNGRAAKEPSGLWRLTSPQK